MALGRFGSCDHVGVRTLRPAVPNILDQRPMEQRDVLWNDRDRFVEAVLRDGGNILAVDQDSTCPHVIKPLQQREQVDLPPPDRPIKPTR